jgi:polysaccharide export outer membrane protein
MKKTAILLVLAGALALPAPAQTLAGGGAAGSRTGRDADVRAYRLGPEDLIEIQVFDVEGLDREVRVQQDGSILWNPVGKVPVEGLTVDELVERLTALLKSKWLNDPQITIQIKDFKSKMASVIGAVTNPGRYPVIGRKDLVQMISEAGGVTPQAGDAIVILRDGPNGDGTSTITIDLRELSEGGNPELNILIEPNDVISVPIDREIKVFVTGRVNDPGTIRAKMSEGITLMQAIAGAGGVAQGAKQAAVMVKRLDKNGRETRIKVNLRDIIRGKKVDIRLQEGDVVYVPESFW